jgi:hypothetical protein
MNRNEEPSTPNRRSPRVVSLPCGHQVYVELNASLLAVSGPVLDHQLTCGPERPLTFAAWFAIGPISKEDRAALGPRPSASLAN